MNKAINIKKTAPLEVLHSELPYTQDPTALFHALCAGRSDCLLLESAEDRLQAKFEEPSVSGCCRAHCV